MSQPASFVLTKNQVFWSRRSDSHEGIIQEFNLNQDGLRDPNILRVEITSDRLDAPLDSWQFRIDQDILPTWYDAKMDKRRTRKALKKWIAAKVVVDGTITVTDDQVYAYGFATVTAYGSATVKAYDSTTVIAYDSVKVEANDSATVIVYDSATVKAYDSVKVEANDSATVTAYDSVTVTAYGSATVTAHDSVTITVYDSVTVKANGSATVTAHDSVTVMAYDSTTVKAHDSVKVEALGFATVTAYDSTTIEACKQYALVRHFAHTVPCQPTGPHAIVVIYRDKLTQVIRDSTT